MEAQIDIPDAFIEEWKESSIMRGYEVSSLGNVRRIGAAKIRRPQDNGHGYKIVNCKEHGKMKNYYVHRLVAQEFCDNPFGYGEINHRDGCRERNCAENLEWCSRSYNLKHSYDKLGRKNSEKQKEAARNTLAKINNDPLIRKKSTETRMTKYWLLPVEERVSRQKKMIQKVKKPVEQRSLNGKRLRVYDSAAEAERVTSICASNIGLCCRGGIAQAGGYHWRYADGN